MPKLWRNDALRALVLVTVALGWFGGGFGCSRSDTTMREPVVVFGLDDRASGAPAGVWFDLKSVRKMLEKALEDSRRLKLVSEKTPAAFRAELTIKLASEREPRTPDDNEVYRAVQVELTLTRWVSENQQERISAQGQAFRVQDPQEEDRQEGFEQVLGQAIAQAVEFVDLQIENHGLPVEGLDRLLASERTEDRLYTLRTLRSRRVIELVPRVIDLLSDPDPEVAMEAVGVLVDYRDRRAALPLIRMAQGRDQVFLMQIITALAEIQGPVARGYLFTLSAGHGLPTIRERAREALERILLNEQAGGSDSTGKAIALPRAGQDGSNRKRAGGP